MIFSDKDKKIYKEIFNKEFSLTGKDLFQIILLVCLVIIFSELMADKICELLTTKDETLLGSKIRVKFACLVILISTIAFYIYLARKDYVPSKKLLFFTFLSGIVAYQTNLFNQQFFFAFFVYVVILFLCQLHLLIGHLDWQYQIKKAAQIKKKNENKTKIIKGFYLDTSVKDINNDKKGYSDYAKKIANKIKETRHEEAFAIGINGKWGSGKTTMSNFIEEHIGKTKDIVTIKFKPWNSNTPDAIIKDFFETLQDELSQYHAALSRLLIRYSRKLTSIDSNIITQTIEYAANYILDLDATNKVYKKIDDALRDINKKIIIYIDDLDRLEKSEIMEVIRLIRNTANFYNTFFIVTYDKDYVNNAIKDAGIFNEEKFLEKIFQLEVNLPYYKKYELIKELCDKLKELFPDKITEDIEKEVFKESHKQDSNILDDWLENSRDVTRLCNSIMLNYPRVKDYVVFKEFLFIEILRINYPSVYYDLYNRRKDFFDEKQDKYKFKKIEDETTPLEKYLKQKFQNENHNIFRLLNNIFYKRDLLEPYEHQSNHQDSIVRIKRFYLYFNYTNFNNVLSYGEFITSFEKDEQHFFNKIREWAKDDLGTELFERFEQIVVFESIEDFEKYGRGLLLLHIIDSNYYYMAKAYSSTIFNENYINKFYNGKFEDAIQNTIKPTVLIEVNKKLNFIDYILNKNGLLDNQKKKFDNTLLLCLDSLINKSKKYDFPIWNCARLIYNQSKVKNQVNQKLQKFVLKNDLNGFLLRSIDPFENPIFKIMKIPIEAVFGNLEKFEELLQSKKDDSPHIKEYINFYEKCKKNNFEQVDFEFDIIPIEYWRIEWQNS